MESLAIYSFGVRACACKRARACLSRRRDRAAVADLTHGTLEYLRFEGGSELFDDRSLGDVVRVRRNFLDRNTVDLVKRDVICTAQEEDGCGSDTVLNAGGINCSVAS